MLFIKCCWGIIPMIITLVLVVSKVRVTQQHTQLIINFRIIPVHSLWTIILTRCNFIRHCLIIGQVNYFILPQIVELIFIAITNVIFTLWYTMIIRMLLLVLLLLLLAMKIVAIVVPIVAKNPCRRYSKIVQICFFVQMIWTWLIHALLLLLLFLLLLLLLLS